MCHDDDARPPTPPRITGASTGHDVVLSAADGNEFLGYLATAEHPTGPRFVLVPDGRGLHLFYRELARTFATAGITTLAIDYYGRTAGVAWRGDSFDEDGSEHLSRVRRAQTVDDVRAAVAHLGDGPTFVIGFCYGGGVALLSGTSDLPLAGVIGFYPYTGEVGQDTALPDEFVADVTCPLIAFVGDIDHAIPVERARALAANLSGPGQEIVIYPGEKHGFFEEPAAGSTAAADAWRRLLDFVVPA